jgi:hypothetical protein
MKVKLNDRILTGHDSYDAGETVVLPKAVAEDLIARGLARKLNGRGKGMGDNAGGSEAPHQEDPDPEFEPQIADDDTEHPE